LPQAPVDAAWIALPTFWSNVFPACPRLLPASCQECAAVDTIPPTQPFAVLGRAGLPAAGAAGTFAVAVLTFAAGAAGAATAGAAPGGAAEVELMGTADEAVLETAEKEAAAAPPIIAPAIAQRMRKRFI
jgi:hypothetical protein